MTDRETVINGLEYLLAAYAFDSEEAGWIGDAIDMLKALEPVKPKFFDGFSHLCGQCERVISRAYSHCPWCGKAVKWE